MRVGVDYYSGYPAATLQADVPSINECGLQILRLNLTPQWNAPALIPVAKAANLEVLGVLYNRALKDANDIVGWQNYVANMVASFKDSVKYWEVWNEPNWNTGFGSPPPDLAVTYMNWLKATYTQAKLADPTCIILGGSILAADSSGQNFLRSMYDNGAKNYMDIVAFHPYCANSSPLYPNVTSTGKAFWKAQNMYDIMVSYGDGDKKVWISEVGWNTGGANSVTEAVQAQYLVDGLTLAESWSWLDAMVIYCWIDSSSFPFGLLRPDRSRKPSFGAVKAFIAGQPPPAQKYYFNHWQDGDTNPVKTVQV